MPRRKKKAADPKPTSPSEGDAYTIDEFCQRNRISKAFYYKLRKKKQTPDELRLGGKVLISKEAAARWRAQREAGGA